MGAKGFLNDDGRALIVIESVLTPIVLMKICSNKVEELLVMDLGRYLPVKAKHNLCGAVTLTERTDPVLCSVRAFVSSAQDVATAKDLYGRADRR